MKLMTLNSIFKNHFLTPSHVNVLTSYCYERLAFIAFYEQRDLIAALGFVGKAIDTYPTSANQAWLVQVYILRSRIYKDRREYKAALEVAEDAVSIANASGPDNRRESG